MDNILPSFDSLIDYLNNKKSQLSNPVDQQTLENRITNLTNFRNNTLVNQIQYVSDNFEDAKEDFASYMLQMMSSPKTSIFGPIVSDVGILPMKETYYNKTASEFKNYILSTLCDINFNSTLNELLTLCDHIENLFSTIGNSAEDMVKNVLVKPANELLRKIQKLSKTCAFFDKLNQLSKNIDLDTIECLIELTNSGTTNGNIAQKILNGTYSSQQDIINESYQELTTYKTNVKDYIIDTYLSDYISQVQTIYDYYVTNGPVCSNKDLLTNVLQELNDLVNKIKKCFKRLPSS